MELSLTPPLRSIVTEPLCSSAVTALRRQCLVRSRNRYDRTFDSALYSTVGVPGLRRGGLGGVALVITLATSWSVIRHAGTVWAAKANHALRTDCTPRVGSFGFSAECTVPD